MKLIIVALALVAVASAGVIDPTIIEKKVIEILRSAFNPQPDGGYEFNFESNDGIVREETGAVKEVEDEEKKPHKVVVVRGSYSYPGADGKPVSINYYADETGYHADGETIPKGPVVARR